MRFLFPQALLLFIPLALWTVRSARGRRGVLALRLSLGALAVVALAEPVVSFREGGSDLVVVVDRSRSMPRGSDSAAEELIRYAEHERGPGDRIAVVAFGREPHVEQPPTAAQGFGSFQQPVDADGSNVGRALDAALELLPPDRTGRVLLITDGKDTGTDTKAAARRFAARGVPLDFRQLARDDAALDVAVTGLDAPSQAHEREPIQLSATVHASAPMRATVELRRNGALVAKGPVDLTAGDNRIPLRDLVERQGLARYEVRVTAPGDGTPENDVGRALLQVEGPPQVVVITASGAPSALTRALTQAGLHPQVRAPEGLTLSSLTGVGAVVVEDVEASALGESGLHVLTDYVEQAGGGLVMTGGPHSYGVGGYRRSVLEPVLPVSLEVRHEQRRASVGIALLMDCSCSMGITIPDGRTKMQLAAEGAVSALQLLGPDDDASVHMVDTRPHELRAMSPVSEGLPLDKVAAGFSGGGGIYIDVALHEAQKQIQSSDKKTRHVLLFSDANDSEQGGDYQQVVDALQQQHVTVSVIGMGSDRDKDAPLLEDIARRGNGRIYFADDVTSLPRIFSQETLLVAKASFIRGTVPLVAGPDLALLGQLSGSNLPTTDGYNLAYPRPLSAVAIRTGDDNQAPLLAFWPHGTGRSAALLAEVDGPETGALRSWPQFTALLEDTVRWTMARSAVHGAVVRATRSGDQLHITADFDADQAPTAAPTLMLLSDDGSSRPVEIPMSWEDGDRLGARVPLQAGHAVFPVVKLGDRALTAPPAVLPYAPEFLPRSAKDGRALLEQLARLTGGKERLSLSGIFKESKQSESGVALAPMLALAALLALLAEVIVRRFFAGQHVAAPSRVRTARRAARPEPRRSTQPIQPQAPSPSASVQAIASVLPSTQEVPPPPAPAKSALEQAREKAAQRLKR